MPTPASLAMALSDAPVPSRANALRGDLEQPLLVLLSIRTHKWTLLRLLFPGDRQQRATGKRLLWWHHCGANVGEGGRGR